MANTEFKTRVKNKRDTAANWESKNPVILNGELILVDTSTGELRAKIGDGTKKYNELSFSDEVLKQSVASIQNAIDNGLPANGGNACTVDGKHAEDFVAATEFNRLVGDTPVAEQINTAQTAAQNYTDEKIEALKSGTVAKAETATKADIATKADSATQADNATTANHATTAGKATEADHADTATTANSATTAGHATTADTATEANHAITATSADKATKDGTGNVIVNTYETKADATAKLETVKSYTDSEMERLVGDTKVSEQIATSIASKADANHNHDDRYYTELEMDSKLGDKADKGHTHDYAASAHTHDDRYYTETEIDAKLIGKSDVNHTHDYASASHAHDDVYAKKTDVSTQFNTLVGDRSVATQINSAVDPLKTIIYKDTSGDINIDRTHTDAMNSKLEITGRDVIFTDYAMTEYPIISTLNNKSDKGHTHNYAGSSTAGGSATSADKLKTAVYIDGVPFNGSGDIDHLATCVTAAGTAAKVAGMANNYQFSLKVGARVTVRFANGNTAANPTLNVASTGAKPIYLGGLALPASQYWTSGSVLDFIYYGSAWELVTIANDNNTTYSSATTSAAGLMSAADKSKLDGIATGANNYTYTLPTASSSTLGGVKIGSNISNSSGTISLTKSNVTTALGYTPLDSLPSHTHTRSEISDFSHTHTGLVEGNYTAILTTYGNFRLSAVTTAAETGTIGTSDIPWRSGYFSQGVWVDGNKIPDIAYGTQAASSVNTQSYKDVPITFPFTYKAAPSMSLTLVSTSTSGDIGQISAAVYSVSTTGCTVRLFNSGGSSRSPGFHWVAVGTRV